MKTFIALTFIGILTYAYAAGYVTISECKNPKPMNDFSATKFFKERWYVSHVKNNTGDNVCQSFSTAKTSDGIYVTEYGLDKNDKTNVRCEAQAEKEKRLTFDCKKDGKSIYQVVFIVMGTDYDNWAVFYRCITMVPSGAKADNYLALSRINGKEDMSGAQGLVNELGLIKCSQLPKQPAA